MPERIRQTFACVQNKCLQLIGMNYLFMASSYFIAGQGTLCEYVMKSGHAVVRIDRPVVQTLTVVGLPKNVNISC